MTFRKIETNTYEAEKDGFDYHIRFESDEWYVDAFYSNVSDPSKAHVCTEVFQKFQSAIDWISDYGART